MFPAKSENPKVLGFRPTGASEGRFRGPRAEVRLMGEGCYIVPGEPLAPVEKGLVNERTDYGSSHD